MSYGLTVKLLQDVLPIDEPLHAVTIRNHVLQVAQRLEDGLGDKQWSFIDKRPAEVATLPIPHGPLTVGIDGGYVKAQGKQGSFEVIAGKKPRSLSPASVLPSCRPMIRNPNAGSSRCSSPKATSSISRSCFSPMAAIACATSNPISTPGRASLRLVPRDDAPDGDAADRQKSARDDEDEEMTYEVRAPVTKELERLKWFLWHGNVYQALQVIQSVEGDLEVAVATSSDSTARKLLKAVEEFHTYIENNAGFIPNYGERYRHGERISTGFSVGAPTQRYP